MITNSHEIKTLISEDMKEGFQRLESIFNTERVKVNEFLGLKGRFNTLERDRNNGIIGHTEYYREINQIRLACLGLIDEVEDVFISSSNQKIKNTQSGIEDSEFPRLIIELIPDGKWKSPIKLSRNNQVDEDGAIWAHNALYLNEIGWRYKLVIRNNSSYPAFYPEMIFEEGEFNRYLDEMNRNEAIPPFSNIDLKAEYVKVLESTGREAYEYMQQNDLPDELKNLSINLIYKNEQNANFKTNFKIQEDNGHNEITKAE